MNNTMIGQASSGPFTPRQPGAAWAARVPFVLPQTMFAASTVVFNTGPGIEAKVNFASASVDVTIKHNLGHPIQNVWVTSAPNGTYFPAICISSTTLSNTGQQLILRANAAAGACVVVAF